MSSSKMYNYKFKVYGLEDFETDEHINEFMEELNEADPEEAVYGKIISVDWIESDEKKACYVNAETHNKQIADRMNGKEYNGVVL